MQGISPRWAPARWRDGEQKEVSAPAGHFCVKCSHELARINIKRAAKGQQFDNVDSSLAALALADEALRILRTF